VASGTLVIDVERCKGCELCVAACPPGVLTMSVEVNATGYPYPRLHPGCTGCTACQLVCPDFVFEVYRADRDTTQRPARAAAPTAPTAPAEPPGGAG